jgi:hypothetical protein
VELEATRALKAAINETADEAIEEKVRKAVRAGCDSERN